MTTRRRALDPRRRPRQRRSRDTVSFLMEAAAQVFGERGYERTTTDRVAERAGVSIGTLYQYFPNKDALLLALAREHLGHARAVFDDVAAGLRAAEPPLPDVVRRLVEAAAALNDRPVHAVLVDEAPRPPELRAELAALHAAVAGEVASHLRRLGVGGPDPAATALVLVHAVDGVVHRTVLRPPPGATRESCVEEAVALCLGYLGLRGGPGVNMPTSAARPAASDSG